MRGVGEHLAKDRSTNIAGESHGREGGETSDDDHQDHHHQGDGSHFCASTPDVGDIAGGDAVVDDVGVDRRKIEVACGLNQRQNQDHRDGPAVRLGKAVNQRQQHSVSIVPC